MTERTILTQGTHSAVSMADYLADPCPEPSLSSGAIKTIVTKTPLHAKLKHPRLGARDYSSSKDADIGSAVHSMVLGGPRVVWIGENDYRKNVAKDARDAAYGRDEIPLLEKQRRQVESMAASASALISSNDMEGPSEQTILWEERGVWFRTRIDSVPDRRPLLADIKTTASADPHQWIRNYMIQNGYDVQSALYTRGYREVTGENRDFVFLLIERDYPYEASLVGAGPDVVELGMEKVDKAIEIWRECLETDTWPGYGNHIVWASAPSWARWDLEARGAQEQMEKSE